MAFISLPTCEESEEGFDLSVDEEATRKFSPPSALKEFNPGKVLDIREKSDREKIEKLLDIAKELKRIIKASVIG